VDKSQQARAIESLVANRKHPGAWSGPPDGCAPADETTAYDFLGPYHEAMTVAGFGPRAGFKIGCTTKVMQDFMQIDHPCWGGVFENTIYCGDTSIPYDTFNQIGVENEVAVRLTEDIPTAGAPYDRVSIGAYVTTVHAAIELVDNRYADFRTLSTPVLITDDFFNAGLVLGPEVPGWQSIDLGAINARTLVNGEEAGRGTGADILGHPLEALAWLANHRLFRGEALTAGEIVSLGSMVQVQWMSPGDTATMEIEHLGAVSVTFTA
jgi:2-keto-4-pentenoate hydratase